VQATAGVLLAAPAMRRFAVDVNHDAMNRGVVMRVCDRRYNLSFPNPPPGKRRDCDCVWVAWPSEFLPSRCVRELPSRDSSCFIREPFSYVEITLTLRRVFEGQVDEITHSRPTHVALRTGRDNLSSLPKRDVLSRDSRTIPATARDRAPVPTCGICGVALRR